MIVDTLKNPHVRVRVAEFRLQPCWVDSNRQWAASS